MKDGQSRPLLLKIAVHPSHIWACPLALPTTSCHLHTTRIHLKISVHPRNHVLKVVRQRLEPHEANMHDAAVDPVGAMRELTIHAINSNRDTSEKTAEFVVPFTLKVFFFDSMVFPFWTNILGSSQASSNKSITVILAFWKYISIYSKTRFIQKWDWTKPNKVIWVRHYLVVSSATLTRNWHTSLRLSWYWHLMTWYQQGGVSRLRNCLGRMI